MADRRRPGERREPDLFDTAGRQFRSLEEVSEATTGGSEIAEFDPDNPVSEFRQERNSAPKIKKPFQAGNSFG